MLFIDETFLLRECRDVNLGVTFFFLNCAYTKIRDSKDLNGLKSLVVVKGGETPSLCFRT